MTKPVLPKRFHFFTITQALGAYNDNIFRTLIQLFVLQILVSADSEEMLSQATFVFTVPFVLFGPWSGYFADKYPKHSLMRIIKICEIAVMLLGIYAFYVGDFYFLLWVLFLMATQSTFFSPAKQGIIPEMCEPESITHANGWVEMTTFVFIIMGIVAAGALMDLHDNNAMLAAIYCVGFAVIGSITVFFIPKMPAAGASKAFPWNPLLGIIQDLRFLKRQKGLWLAGLANSYFWMTGMIFSINILVYGDKLLKLDADDNVKLTFLPAFIAIGIATGSMLASRLSSSKVELGLVPLGGFGIAAGGIGLFFSADSYLATAILLTFTGISGGLYIVPLFAYLQFVADEQEKGRVLATVGILNGLFLVLGSVLYYLLAVQLAFAANTIFLVIGLSTIVAVCYICTVIPEYFIRFCAWLLTHTFYSIKIEGSQNVPLRGPALIVPNHVTFVDAFLVGSTVQRFVRFIMLKAYYDVPVVRRMFNIMDVIPIAPGEGKESVAKSLAAARQRLLDGRAVCIFAEGALTRDGEMHEFRPGFETVMHGVDCPIIPVYIGDVWGSIFSWEGGKVIWKMPKKIPFPVSITYGDPLPPTATAAEVEQAVRSIAELAASS